MDACIVFKKMNIYLKLILKSLGYSLLFYPFAYICISVESVAFPNSIIWLETLILTVGASIFANFAYHYPEIKEYRKKKTVKKNENNDNINNDNVNDNNVNNSNNQ